MKTLTFSTILFIYVALSYANAIIASEHDYVREYYSELQIISSDKGCYSHHSENTPNTLKSRSVKVGKPYGKNRKRQVRTPIEKPFKAQFACNSATDEQCEQLRKAFDYANNIFAKALAFVEPVIIQFDVRDEEGLYYNAATNVPPMYVLKDPEETSPFTYPVPLIKQVNTDRPIKFNQKDDYDFKINFNIRTINKANHIEATVVHEILHGLGFFSQLRKINDGFFENNTPFVGNNYYMQGILKIEKPEEGLSIINGFIPINIYERHFVEYKNPNRYLFSPSFNSLADELNLDYTVHYSQPYYSERKNLEKLSDMVRNWPGMQDGENFYNISHKANTFAFKTKDNRLVTICSYSSGEDDANIEHICSQNFVLKKRTDYSWKDNEIDQNFVIYPYNIGLGLSAEEKISRYNPNSKYGLLGDDLVSLLATMGYPTRAYPVSQKTYQFITDTTELVQASKIIDSDYLDIHNAKLLNSTKKNNKHNKASKSAAMSSISTNHLILCLYTILSVFILFF